MRQLNRPPARIKRNKYSGTRAFFLVLLIISTFAVWSKLRNDPSRYPAADGKTLQRRVAEAPLEAHMSLKKRDLDVRPPA